RALLSPETPLHNAWIPADEGEGQDYWRALQIIRAWTKASHFAIHDAVASHLGREVRERFWNEHNFVFFRDGLYYHAKGATPAWGDFAPDSSGKMLIPLNMAAPVLVVHGSDAPHGLGFCPHGAGRNFGRREFVRRQGDRTPEELMAEQTRGIDARFFCGIPDASELPGAYKDANAVRAQIDAFGLAEVVDEITPLGSIMAGDWEQPFRARRQRLREEKRQTPGTAPDPGAPDDTTL
ncbi:MAG: RtcB family protein, partial [Candidatus Competibacterales bacterium]